VATETDAARDRVLAARAAFGEEVEVLEASARAAVDIPAKVRRSPAKAAAIAGGAGFIVLGGPRRVFRKVKRAIRGPEAALPSAMLPDEIERSLRALGTDGDKVRGALERDFAAYVSKAARDRTRLRTFLLISIVRPIVFQGARVAAERLFRPDEEGFAARLAQVRERAAQRDRGAGGPTADANGQQASGTSDDSGSTAA
jgi:hypothetical protein